MSRTLAVGVLSLAVLVLGGCNRKEGTPAPGTPSPTASAPTLTADAAKQKADELAAWAGDRTINDGEYTPKAVRRITELTNANQGELAAAALIKVLKSDYVPSRTRAAQSLRQVGRQAQKYLPELIEALSDNEYFVRREVAVAVGAACNPKGGPQPADTAKAVAALMKVLDEPPPPDTEAQRKSGLRPMASYALLGLSTMGPGAAPAVPKMIGLLDSPSASVRSHAAYALGRIGKPVASDAVPALKRMAESDPDQSPKNNAANALKLLGP